MSNCPLAGVVARAVPPLAIPKIPVTSALERVTAEEENTPAEEMWAIPVESPETVRLVVVTLVEETVLIPRVERVEEPVTVRLPEIAVVPVPETLHLEEELTCRLIKSPLYPAAALMPR